MKDIVEQNNYISGRISLFLNLNSRAVNKEMVSKMMEASGLSEIDSIKYLLAEFLNLDIYESSSDMEIFRNYFDWLIFKCDKNIYMSNPYYQNIKFGNVKGGDVEFYMGEYKPYEIFVCDDLEKTEDGRIIPRLGFFDETFCYPAVSEKGREWMSVTPNEVETMKLPIKNAFGKVLTFGLGLGYFQYMISLKPEVQEVWIVERSDKIINMFSRVILPRIKDKSKFKIIKDDAFDFAKKYYPKGYFDYVFVDIWHDAGDGLPLYKKFKELEKLNPKMKYDYWIEKTLKSYL